MTAPQEQFAAIADRSQEAVTTAIRTWADTVQAFAGKVSAGQARVPDMSSVVDQYFDFAEKVLADQRELARQWASATVKAAGAVGAQAASAAERAASTAEQAASATEQAASTGAPPIAEAETLVDTAARTAAETTRAAAEAASPAARPDAAG